MVLGAWTIECASLRQKEISCASNGVVAFVRWYPRVDVEMRRNWLAVRGRAMVFSLVLFKFTVASSLLFCGPITFLEKVLECSLVRIHFVWAVVALIA